MILHMKKIFSEYSVFFHDWSNGDRFWWNLFLCFLIFRLPTSYFNSYFSLLNWFLAIKNKIADVNFSFVWVGEFSSFLEKLNFLLKMSKKLNTKAAGYKFSQMLIYLYLRCKKEYQKLLSWANLTRSPKLYA